MKLMILLCMTILLAGCVPALPETAYPVSNTYRVETDIRFQLARRDYLLHVPPRVSPDQPLPLVVVLHGAFSTASQTERETGFSQLADQMKFLVAYPEGIGIFGLLQHWNAGHCCGKAAADGIDDVGYVAEVISSIRRRMDVDPQRIYLAGMSNGGMLTYRYAAERGEELAAIAVVSGAIGSKVAGESPSWTIPRPGHPLSVIAFHGTGDEHIPLEGGTSPLNGGERSYRSVAEAMQFWEKANHCENGPRVDEENAGGIQSFEWNTCQQGTAIAYYLLKDWGHRWPGPHFTADLPDGNRLKNFNATERIWQFFSEHRR